MAASAVIGPLVAGMLIAFGLQLLLVSAGVALGITIIKVLPQASLGRSESSAQSRNTPWAVLGGLVLLAVLLTVGMVLGVACFLAVRLSATRDPVAGAILGLVIGSAYVLILSWLGAKAIAMAATLTQKLMKVGWQGISSGTQTVMSGVVERVSSTSTKAIRDEVKGYLLHASRNQFRPKDIQEKLQEIVFHPEYDLESRQKQLARVDRKDIVGWLQQRDDLSEKKIHKIANRLESSLTAVIEQTEAELDSQPDSPNPTIAQSLLEVEPDITGLDYPQLALLHWLKKYPALAPKLVQLIFQVDWPWFKEPSNGDRVDPTQADLKKPIHFVKQQASTQFNSLKQQTLSKLEMPYNLTLAASWWVFGMAVTILVSGAIGGTLAAYSVR